MSTTPASPDDRLLEHLLLERLRALGRALAQAPDRETCRHLLGQIPEWETDATAGDTAPAGVGSATALAAACGDAGPAQLARLARRHTAGALVSTLIHELSQPLSAIGMYSSAAARLVELGTLDAGELGPVLRQIETQVKRAADLLAGVRALTRDGAAPVRRGDLCRAVVDAVALIRPLATGKRITILLAGHEAPLPVAADPPQVTQVVLNLLFNAIEAIEQAGTTERNISVGVYPEPGAVRVRVCDSGPGLSPAAAQRVFEGPLTDRTQGCGLGLIISRALIEGMGGRLWIDPERDPGVNHGAVFQFRLPVLPREDPAAPPGGATQAEAHGDRAVARG